MCPTKNVSSQICEIYGNQRVNFETFILHVDWQGAPPKAGQFFMIKPARSSVFLPRPISIFEYDASQNLVKFLIAIRGRGTMELSQLQVGDRLRLTGPHGNSWADFLPESGKAALIGGSVGVAPLAALVAERPDFHFYFFAGFKEGFREKDEESLILGAAIKSKKLLITAEDGKNALGGHITDFLFEPENYDAVFACGSKQMLQVIKEKCDKVNANCFLSMESRLACGAGACLGCVIHTVKGNRRCCADGPIFPAREVLLDE